MANIAEPKKGFAVSDRQKDIIQKFAALGSLFALVAVFSATSNAFFTVNNGMTIALQVTSIALLGIGATCVIITGGIDLSVGSVLALAGVVAALAVKELGMPVARGVALQITGARAVSGLGESFGELGNGALFRIVTIGDDGFPNVVFPGIPYPVILMVVIALAVSFMLNRSILGRHIYAVGSNADAARLSGVNVARVTNFTYILSGTLAGLTGCVLMSRLVTAQPNEGVMYELDAIASAVIGGTSLIGGVGTISGTAIGAFVIGILRNGLNMNGVSAFTQQIIIGLVILVTVWIDQLRNRR